MQIIKGKFPNFKKLVLLTVSNTSNYNSILYIDCIKLSQIFIINIIITISNLKLGFECDNVIYHFIQTIQKYT